MSFNILAKEGGCLRSGRKQVKDKYTPGSNFFIVLQEKKSFSKLI